MALYLYNPGNKAAFQAESIAIFGLTPEEVEAEHRTLLTEGIKAVARGIISEAEVKQQLAKASPSRLPVELVSRLLDPEHYPAPVMEIKDRLGMHAPRQEGKPNFALVSKEVDSIEDFVADGRLDQETLDAFAVKDLVTHEAVQYQPVVAEGQILNARSHGSLGYIGVQGYRPVLTVLGSEHPVRQLIDQKQAA